MVGMAAVVFETRDSGMLIAVWGVLDDRLKSKYILKAGVH